MAEDSKKESWADVSDSLAQQSAINSLQNLTTKDEERPLKELEKKLQAADRRGLTKGKVIVEQEDPNSPLYSAKTFQELNLPEALLKGVYAMGFDRPSKIQEKALPILLGSPQKNLIAQAQSGTGKTAAFVLNMLAKCDTAVHFPQAICVCPTRELARQILDNVEKMGKFTELKYQLVVKEEEFPKQITAQVVIGTPGKLLDLIKRGTLTTNKVKVFVLDEADVMIEQGSSLGEQSIKLKKMMPRNCQICLFSATYAQHVRQFAERIVPQPCVNIRLKRAELTLEGIRQLYIDCGSEENKFNVLSDIYNYLSVGQSIIFVHTRKTAQELAKKMKEKGFTVSLLHGGEDMTPKERDQVIDDFRNAVAKVLITTNVLARGIDILQVMLVINYDLPLDGQLRPDPSTYLHRIGRSGRFGRRGIAINFVHDEQSRKNLKFLEDFFKVKIEQFPADKIEELQPMLEKIQEEDYKMLQQAKDDEDE